jgi:conjugal transfer pilus assembly protein TrbC
MAEPGAGVSGADIDAARRGQPVVTDQDLQRARDRNPMPSDEALRRVPVPAPPRIERLPVPATTAPIDLEALARGLDARTSLTSQQPPSGPSVLVFVSFAMPEAALVRLAEQASRAQATLVLRGLVDGSMVRTVARVQHLVAGRKVAVQIDPQAFDRYTVTRTPTFVLVRDQPTVQACASGPCVPADAYALVSGDVSLDYALAHVQRSEPRFARDAGTFLRRLVR